MSYQEGLCDIYEAHKGEIHAALSRAQADCAMAELALDRAKRRVHFLEYLLQCSGDGLAEGEDFAGGGGGDSKMTLHAAMQHVLRSAPMGKLRAAEIIAEIERLDLYRMRDGRAPESQQIHARASHYPEMFGKEGSYFYAK